MSHSRIWQPAARLATTTFMVALTMLGCSKPKEVQKQTADSANLLIQTRSDQLRQATDFIFSDERFDTDAFNNDVSRSLNQWINSKPQTVEWELDPLVNTWSDEVRLAANLGTMEKLEFLPKDAQYLQLAAWTNSMVQWIGEQPQRIAEFRYLLYPIIQRLTPDELESLRGTEKPVSALLRKANPELTEDEADELCLVWQLFDWTVRNIQLEELASPPTADEIQLFALNRSELNLPAAMGVPGPGYIRLPDQTMKVGRGDAWERGRVFLAMMRSMNVDAAWVGRSVDSSEAANAVPQMIVVLIGNQGFLFDPEFGLPIPNANVDGIATVKEVANESKILTALDIADFELSGRNRKSIEYGIRVWEPSALTLVLDAPPVSLSKRMKVMEQSLTGTRRLQLFEKVTEKSERLRKTTGIENAVLWDVPVLSNHYRRAFDQAVRFKNTRVAQLYFAEQIYDMPCPIKTALTFRNEQETFEQLQYEFIRLRTARHRAITGVFDAASRNDPPGAKQLLLTMRMSDEEIEALETDDRIRAAFGVEQAGPDSQEENTENVIKETLKSVRAVAALWLGIAHYEMGDPSSASQWFTQVETFDEDETWSDLALYSNARSDEARLDYAKAIRVLQSSRSPQAAGDALRARILQSVLDAQQALQEKSPAPAESPEN
ncbi:MAG: tetratricopeptide repeat protein [Pirellulaceae bacterium]